MNHCERMTTYFSDGVVLVQRSQIRAYFGHDVPLADGRLSGVPFFKERNGMVFPLITGRLEFCG